MNATQRLSTDMVFAALVGLPLSGMRCYVGFQSFSFGEWHSTRNLEGKEVLRSEMGLVVGGKWRIEGPDRFVLSSSEHFGDPRTDEHALPFYRSLGGKEPPFVGAVEVHLNGGLTLFFSKGYVLRVLLSSDDPEENTPWHGEVWRFMPPDDHPRGHLVFNARGLAWSR